MPLGRGDDRLLLLPTVIVVSVAYARIYTIPFILFVLFNSIVFCMCNNNVYPTIVSPQIRYHPIIKRSFIGVQIKKEILLDMRFYAVELTRDRRNPTSKIL